MRKMEFSFTIILWLLSIHFANAAQFGSNGLKVGILSVEINSDSKAVVTYTLTDSANNPLSPLTDLSTIRFSLAHLVTDTPGNLNHYENYILNSSGQPTSDASGQHTPQGGAKWQYVFNSKLSNVDVNATHLLAGQITRVVGENTYHSNPILYFVPNGSPVTQTRELTTTETCNGCHTSLGLHGGGRKDIRLCMTCHTPQAVDPETGNSVDFKVYIHKIHMGAELPSVEAGNPYQIIGFRNSIHDYSDVEFPQDIRNCTRCHTGSQADRWKTAPSRAACGSCHDDVNFQTGTNHAKMSNDDLCALCHTPEGGDYSIVDTHLIPAKSPTLRGIVSEITEVKNAAPGNPIEVHFTLRNADDNSTIQVGSMDRLRLTFAGPTSDYKSYTQETVNVTNSVIIDGVYKYIFTEPLPPDATGTFAVALEGRRKVTVQDETINESVFNPIRYFSVDGSDVIARREVVDRANCNKCHDSLEMHGSLRKNVQYCVMCHNPNKTSRPTEGNPVVTVHFKRMIHFIHTGENLKETGTEYVIGSSDFSHVRFPGDRKQCSICHIDESYELPLPPGVLPTVVTENDVVTSIIQPIAAACLSCHTSSDAAAHAQLNTTASGNESCGVCHGEGRIASLDEAHQYYVFLEPQVPNDPSTAIVNWMLDR